MKTTAFSLGIVAFFIPPAPLKSSSKSAPSPTSTTRTPTWLQLAHQKLDRAVFAAYGWPDDLTDEEILERLLALNLERST